MGLSCGCWGHDGSSNDCDVLDHSGPGEAEAGSGSADKGFETKPR